MKTDHWVHLFGTSQGQYDVFYGIIWGTRTAFRTGFIVVIATFLIGVIVGSVSAYDGGAVDNVIMRIVDVFPHPAIHLGCVNFGGRVDAKDR